jgi:hypothetical protein
MWDRIMERTHRGMGEQDILGMWKTRCEDQATFHTPLLVSAIGKETTSLPLPYSVRWVEVYFADQVHCQGPNCLSLKNTFLQQPCGHKQGIEIVFDVLQFLQNAKTQ